MHRPVKNEPDKAMNTEQTETHTPRTDKLNCLKRNRSLTNTLHIDDFAEALILCRSLERALAKAERERDEVIANYKNALKIAIELGEIKPDTDVEYLVDVLLALTKPDKEPTR